MSGFASFIIYWIQLYLTHQYLIGITGKWRLWLTLTTPFDGFNSGHNFPRRKRFGLINFGTQLQSDDLIGFVVFGRLKLDWRLNLFYSNLTGDIQSTTTRTHEIENNKIQRLATVFI